MSAPGPGACRYCGCTEDNACRLAGGDPCAWFDATRTVCSAPGCIRAEVARRRAAGSPAAARYPGWGYGAILEDLRKQRRAKRRRKRAA